LKSVLETLAWDSAKSTELFLSGPDLLGLMRQVLDRGLLFRFRARGWSMSPFIRDGDVISIAPLGKKDPRVGDVVAFTHPDNDHLILHRLVGIHNSTYLIQGDNLFCSPDGLIPVNALLGKVTKVEREGRTVVLGMGPERVLIAFFSRVGLLSTIGRIKVVFQRIIAGNE